MTLMATTCIKCGEESADGGLQCKSCREGKVEVIKGNAMPFPGHVQLVLPWSCLASDNVQGRRTFHEAKARAQAKLRELYQGEPFAGPARVDVVVFVPNRQRRDGPNLWKMLADALKGIVLVDDNFDVLQDGRVRRGGIDADRPRAEITVEAIV